MSIDRFFGSLRRDVQDIILSKAKKKRFYKEGPHSLPLLREDEDDEEEINSYGMKLRGEGTEEEVSVLQITAEGKFGKLDETQESYWARGCSECEIEMEGIREPVRALLDSG